MKALIVVNREDDWPHQIPGAAVATAKSYLTGQAANSDQYRQVVNLCRCARTDDAGFYVSLLAEARGQRPLPTAKALEELHASPANAAAVREIEELVAQSAPARRQLELDAYFGTDPAGELDALAQQLFVLAKAPLLRASFRRDRSRWHLQRLRALSVSEVPARQRPALVRAASLVDLAAWDLRGRISGQSLTELLGGTRRRLPAILVCGYGVASAELIARLRTLRVARPCVLLVDSKDLRRFHNAGATVITPNFLEAWRTIEQASCGRHKIAAGISRKKSFI